MRQRVLPGVFALAGALGWGAPPPLLPEAANPDAAVVPAPAPIATAARETYGALYDTDASLPAAADDVVDYLLSATLDPALHLVHGKGSITWRNASALPVKELWLHLYLNAFKNRRSVYLREPIGGFRGNEPVEDWGTIDLKKLTMQQSEATVDLLAGVELHRPGDDDETDARVPLPKEIAPGESVILDVEWEDKLPSILERTGYAGSFHFMGQWFPKIARLEPSGTWAHFPFHHLAEFYADFGTYDVTLDVPEAFTIGATGPVTESHTAGGRRVERHVQPNVHDFAWTAWDRWKTASETIDGVATKILYPPGFDVDARREMAAMRFALPHFREKYGRYPYGLLTLVHPPENASEAGGMEYPTLITTGGPWYGPPGVFTPEQVTVHEFGHQYFYGLVASDEVSWPFLDEGINSYAESEAAAAWRGPGNMASVLGFTLSDAAIQSVFGNLQEHDQPVAQPAPAFDTGSAYGDLVYARTGAIVETLRRVYGDAKVSTALGRYARKNRFQHPTPDDLVAAFSEVLGEGPSRTMRAALFDKGWVDYAILGIQDQRSSPPAGIFDRDGKRETLPEGKTGDGSFDGWVLVARRGTLSFPVDVELSLADGTATRLRWEGDGDSVRLPYHGKVALRAAVVDPDHAVLLDDNLANNHATVPLEHTAGAPRTFERGLYWAELLLSALSP